MSNGFNPKLKSGFIITCLKDFVVYGTGVTFHYYRGYIYKITDYLPVWFEKGGTHAWKIELIEGKGHSLYDQTGFFSEDDLFKNFNANIYLRKEKLKKLNEKANSTN